MTVRTIEEAWRCTGCDCWVQPSKAEAGGMPMLFGPCQCEGFRGNELKRAIEALDRALLPGEAV